MTLRIVPSLDNNDLMKEVLNKLKHGDHTAFKTFYDFHYSFVFRFVNKLIGNEADAQDITVESFTILWQKRARIKDPQTVRSYLFTISKNAALDYLKKSKIARRYTSEMSRAAFSHEETNAVIWATVMAEFEQRITDLPPGCRNVFEMIYYQNLETDEIANKLNISKQTVLNQKNKAIQLMRKWVAVQNNLLLLEVFEIWARRH